MLLLFVVGGIIFLSSSYALFKREITGRNVELKVGELSYNLESEKLENNQITLKPNSSETLEVTLTSKNEIDSKYELYYKIISPETIENTVDGGYLETSTNPSSGIIESANSKTIQLVFNNTGSQEIVIEIGVQASLPLNEVTLEEGEITLKEIDFQKHYVFDYTGDYQTFTTPEDGTYKIELWGGGTERKTLLGYGGGYTSGKIFLRHDELLYVYVGGVGKKATNTTGTTGGGYNGGGNAGYYAGSLKDYTFGGGGATDVRLLSGIWNDFNSLSSRIMVSGASNGGGDLAAGGLEGYGNATYYLPGNQTSGYAFGYGESSSSGYGGGSGYYGGHTGPGGYNGAGGSSFISGHAGCIAITSETDQTPKVTTYSKIEDSYHYSGKIFTDTIMIDGQGYNWTTTKGEKTDMPTHDLLSTMTGNQGNGYARITYIGE